ncbi:hypothetical protein GPECTOR_34g774 [Gonium pectorale]|uniref:Syndetin C-terminal domain-containing protein n=1 Tax=Gonium pectorale TaxID=33097 RepID=A0A150GDF3_GONPE|nr:hypothetical protein GPECTOR_34g774 [Gonium pectorale]|eukprot:KXZ47615.1 hypothetical protein GPECTOR_34g774 [Gonium pectorale]
MADRDGVGFGQNVLGKLKLVGGKVVDFGGSVAGKVVDVGGTVGNKIGDIGLKIGDKLVDVATKPLFESDFERLRQLNQIARQQQDLRRKYTDDELAAVEARADLVLGQLYKGYFEADFDPVAYELSKLSDSDDQAHIDELVERLTQGVETVSGRLSRHVNKKRDVLLAGIDRVAEVEDDLKAAFMISRSSRSTLKAAAEEVQRNMRVVGQTRRKQSYMELMEVISKIKRARDLQHSLKKSQELGEYGDAIMTCIQCFQGVDTLRQLTVSSELRATVQRLYVDTLRRMDGALANICSEFDPDKYTKILEGYLLQGIDGRALAEKVVQCFKDAIHDVTTRVVRSLLLTKPKLADKLASSSASSLQLGYAELLRALPVDLLRPCLARILEASFDILASYHVMAHWHVLAVAKQGQMAAAAEGLDEESRRAQAATASFLTAVSDILKVSRSEVLDAAARRLRDVLTLDNLFKGEDFLQVVDWCGKFGGVAEAFLGNPTELRGQLMALCARFLPAYHRSNLESLTTCLNNEAWQDIGAVTGAAGAVTLELDTAILESPFYMPSWGEDAAITSFDKWITDGNPFKRGMGAPEGRQKSLLDLLQKTTAEGKELSRTGSQHSNLGEVGAEAATGAVGSDDGGRASTPLQGHSETLFRCLAELFDMYLLYCFSAFGGMGLEDVVWRDDILTPRLKAALIRILSADGSRYKPLVEELLRNRPLGRGAPIASTGLGLLDRFGDKMESFADSMERSVSRMAVKLGDSKLVQVMGGGAEGSGHGGGVQLSGASMVGLQQQVLALPGRCQRDVEAYFNRTVEAAADLREHLFKAAARVMMQGVWDGERGIPTAIGVTNYNVKEPAIRQSPWADFAVRALQVFREKVLAARLPLPLVVCLWEFAVAVVAEGLLTGLAAVRKCTLEGRANMSFDLSHVERQIRAMGPPNFRPAGLAVVDAYVKAFYLPWDELPRWCQAHLGEYGKQRLYTLVEVAAEFHKVKRGQKNDVLEMIDSAQPGLQF